jgi:1-acyl-sn-glycerol-3-phosphate acyltransferase
MKIISTILAYILTPLFYLFFGTTLVIFHIAQVLGLKIGGYKAHKKSVDVLNLGLMNCLRVLGTSFKFNNDYKLPTDKPIIFVSNHQSMFDIPPLIWKLRKHHPKFVSKIELGTGIPSISYNLKHGGSVLIDRKKPDEAIELLKEFGKYISDNSFSAIIFPEGTRSKDGKIKPFKPKGLKTIIDNIPTAYIVPLTINNTWKITKKGNFPLGVGAKVSVFVHEPFLASSMEFDVLFNKVESLIGSKINS